MPKLLPLSARKVIKILEQNVFHKRGQKGSHMKFKKNDGKKVYVVIVPNYSELGHVVLNSIIRKSGLPREMFCG